MFLVSGAIFLVIGAREGDVLTIAGSLVWMLGCGSFLAGSGKES